MRRTFFVVILTGLTAWAAADDVFARPSGGGRGGSSGGRGSVGRTNVGRTNVGRANVGRANVGRANVGRTNVGGGNGGRGYYGGGYGGGGYYGGGYGGGFYGGGLLGALIGGAYYGDLAYGPFSQGYGYGYAPDYYNGAPGYLDPAMMAQTPQVRNSYYPPPPQNFARVTVLVPTANAQVWFENAATTQTGTQRLFESPPLTPNENFTYTIKARWMENGKPVNQERHVNVQAGQDITVTFEDRGEEVPLPTSGTTSPQK